jgi:CheY-like chemotaxis protein
MTHLLLRAELTIGTETIVTHTMEVSRDQITVACAAQLARGDVVDVALSFHGLVARMELRCRVVALHPPEGDTHLPSITCDVVGASDETRARLGALAEAKGAAARAYRCILVEDNQFIRDLFAYGIRKYGSKRSRAISIASARDAEEAWRILEAEPYDMAIIDHFLPAQSGAELISRIRANPRLSQMSVVAISVGGTEIRDASMAAGADLFLEKPIVLQDLFATLDKLATEVTQ